MKHNEALRRGSQAPVRDRHAPHPVSESPPFSARLHSYKVEGRTICALGYAAA